MARGAIPAIGLKGAFVSHLHSYFCFEVGKREIFDMSSIKQQLRSMFSPEKPKIGIAFGSGGARGWAHIGVIRALKECGIQPTCLSGSSIGAIAAALWAEDRLDAFEELAGGMNPKTAAALFLEFKLNRGGLFSGERAMQTLRKLLPVESFSELPIPFAAVATDLNDGRPVVLNTGYILDALRASFAIPGIFVPAVTPKGRVLIDGAYSNPLPMDVVRAMGAEYVIAVNIDSTIACPYQTDVVSKVEQTLIHAQNRISAFLRENGWFSSLHRKTDDDGKWRGGKPGRREKPESKPASLGMMDVILRAMRLAENRLILEQLALSPPDLLIEPPVGDIATMDFSRSGDAIRAGYEAAMRVLAHAKIPGER